MDVQSGGSGWREVSQTPITSNDFTLIVGLRWPQLAQLFLYLQAPFYVLIKTY